MATRTNVEHPASAAPADTIRVYSTLTRTKEPFQTVEPGKVGIYLCGPTVYDRAHIGHMVGPVIFDTIKRYLEYSGYRVTWVVNITDVDDKLINKARERGLDMSQVAAENTEDYLRNLAELGVDQIDHMPKATETMEGIVAFTQALIDAGFAYESEGDVFFDVAKDPEYGKLTNRSVDALQGEGGGAAARKRSPADFALWKRAKPGEPAWASPWGLGRPGWHIECSAMSKLLLGESFDIHGGGLDLVFPHHENEVAQSECLHGKPMARYWMHNGLLKRDAAGKIGGRAERDGGDETDRSLSLDQIQSATAAKMSRSGGAGGLADLIRREGGERLRFFLLRTHYRSTVLFSDEALAETETALDSFYRFFERYQRVTGQSFFELQAPQSRIAPRREAGDDELLEAVVQARGSFLAKMDDDFNTGGAISELFELLRALNKHVDRHGLEDTAGRDLARMEPFVEGVRTLRELAMLLGIFVREPRAAGPGNELVGQLVELMIELRSESRQRKDFATADKIRDSLAKMGITLEDRKEGTSWRLG